MTGYRPIDCALYAGYELAILRRRVVMLGWRDGDGLTRLERVRPVDLETRAGEEFLVFRGARGVQGRVRLDRIVEFRDAGGPAQGRD